MKRLVYIAMVIMLFLAGCISATEQPETANTITDTVIPPPTSTKTPLPTATKRPSATPSIPTATITPMSVAPTSISPLALNEFNAATEMKRLNIIGTGVAHDIKFSPDGKLFAVATGRGIYLYDGTTFEQSGFIDVNDTVSAIAFSPDGSVLAVAVDGKVSLWNVVSGQSMLSLDGGLVGIGKLAYGRGGQVAAIGGDCRGCGSPQMAMILWDAKTGHQIYVERNIWYFTNALAFTPDGGQLFFGGQNGVTVVDSETGAKVETSNSMKIGAPYNMMFNKDGSNLFITSFEDANLMFDMSTQTQSTFSFCGAYLADAGEFGACIWNQKAVVFDALTGKEIKSIDTNIDAPSYSDVLLALSPDARFLAYEEGDIIRAMSVDDGMIVKSLEFPEFYAVGTGLVFLNGSERYFAAVEYPVGQISLIDIQTGETLRTFKMECCEITGFAFVPDRRTVATMGDHILQVWDLSSQQVVYEASFRPDFSGPIAFSPDGSSIFMSHSFEKYILQFDLQTRESVKAGGNLYSYSYSELFAVDNYHFNRFGNLVVLAYENFVPSFIDSKTQEKITIPLGSVSELDFPETFAISPNDKYLVLGGYNGISVWNSQTQKLLLQLVGHEQRGGDGWAGAIKSLMFSPQSNLLVSVGWDGTTRFWNIITGNEIRRLNVCCSASFTPDGRYLVTAGDGVIRVWGIP